MAIYHLTSTIITRSKGKSAVASAAYRHACIMKDEKLEKTFDYSRKLHVIHSELLIPDQAPSWAKDLIDEDKHHVNAASEVLWNKVEASEKRKDSQLAREIEFSLPIELSPEQNIMLAREFIQDQFVKLGMIADWSVHWEPNNPHVHVMLTMRDLNELGFGLKIREWNVKILHQAWREKWGEYANLHLHRHGLDVRIDHRSYQDQGIELLPTIHRGMSYPTLVAKHKNAPRVHRVNHIGQENLRRIAARPQVLLEKIERESSTFTSEKLAQELVRYVPREAQAEQPVTPVISKLLLEHLTAATVDSPPSDSSVLSSQDHEKILADIEQFDSVFSERELAKAVLPYTDQADAFARAVMELKSSPHLIPLGPGDDGRMRFTTRRMFDLENRLQDMADVLKGQRTRQISLRAINKALARHEAVTQKTLTPEQRDAVLHLVKPDRVSCVVGRAGTGKSFSLGAAKAVWEAQGLKVQGIALSGIAADGLSKDAGIPSATIASFLLALKEGRQQLDPHNVVVMDEAGMTDIHSMLAVLEAVQQSKAKLTLVGDPAQIQPVGPDAVFRALLERLGSVELHTVYRQNHPWQREATVAFSAGRMDEALRAYEAEGCIRLEKDSRAAMNALVADWLATRHEHQAPVEQCLVIAHRNEDVQALNGHLRAARVARGEISEGYRVASSKGDLLIAEGDRLLFLKNDKRLGISNGRFATITSVTFTESGQVMHFTAVLDGTGDEVTINPKHYAHFAHGYAATGYAATVHKVQGMTVDHSFVYAGGYSWNRHLTYVAMSRHRESARLYAGQDTYKDVAALKKGLSRYALKDSLLDFPLAFAERRGIELTESQQRKLSQHVTQRLAAFKLQLVDQGQRLVNPQGYWQRKKLSYKNILITKPSSSHVRMPRWLHLMLRRIKRWVKAGPLFKNVCEAWVLRRCRMKRMSLRSFRALRNIKRCN